MLRSPFFFQGGASMSLVGASRTGLRGLHLLNARLAREARRLLRRRRSALRRRLWRGSFGPFGPRAGLEVYARALLARLLIRRLRSGAPTLEMLARRPD